MVHLKYSEIITTVNDSILDKIEVFFRHFERDEEKMGKYEESKFGRYNVPYLQTLISRIIVTKSGYIMMNDSGILISYISSSILIPEYKYLSEIFEYSLTKINSARLFKDYVILGNYLLENKLIHSYMSPIKIRNMIEKKIWQSH